ncbi:hypothetical protein NPIL_373181 [Nephila pilipes]|uniref:Uncharacterized protein n=1 Tax=Nephila pilipes TaxID=299642 RepID=A0A8X6MTM4_NEPPI|nr:hypothetical protein NPIL_373181 [Nephila pilipes]
MSDAVILIIMLMKRKTFRQIACQITSFAIHMHISKAKLRNIACETKRICFRLLFGHIVIALSTLLLLIFDRYNAVLYFRAYTLNLVNDALLQQYSALVLLLAAVVIFMWISTSMLFVSFYSSVCIFLSSIIDTFSERVEMIKSDEFRELMDFINYMEMIIRYIDRNLSLLAFVTFLNVLGVCINAAIEIALSTLFTALVEGHKVIYFLYSFNLSLQLVMRAADVDDVGRHLRLLGHNIPWKQPQFTELRFLLIMRLKNMKTTLTLWRTWSFNKNFLLTYCSALLSYFIILISL